MIAEKIRSVSKTLGVLAGQVTEEQWEFLKMARAELSDAADTAQEMEARLNCPMPGQETSPLGKMGSVAGLFQGLDVGLGPDRTVLHVVGASPAAIKQIIERVRGRMSPPAAGNTGTPPEAAPGATRGGADGTA